MQEHKKLQEASVTDLLNELRAREVESAASPGFESAATPRPARDTRFQEFDSATISQSLRGKQEVIYGSDDRIDVFQVSDPAILNQESRKQGCGRNIGA